MAVGGRLYLFGYGSLPFSPERPDLLREVLPARLPGHRRAFNKISSSSQCAVAESYAAFDEPALARFRRGGVFRSLVLGTEAAATEAIEGFVLAYPIGAAAEVLQMVDAREGYASGRDRLKNGYLRVTAAAERIDDGATLTEVVVYLSNPDPACAYYCPDALTRDQRAKVLVNATPRRAAGPTERRGLYYLERTRRILREQAGLCDPQLEGLAAAIRGLDGPWGELVEPPG